MEHGRYLQVASRSDQRGSKLPMSDLQLPSSSNIGVAYRFVCPIPASSQKIPQTLQQPFGFVMGPPCGSAAQAFASNQIPSDTTGLPRTASMSFQYPTYPTMFGFPSEISGVPIHLPFPAINYPMGSTFVPVQLPAHPQHRFHFPQTRFVYPSTASNNSVSSLLCNVTSRSDACDVAQPAKVLPVFDSDESDETPQDLSFRSDISLTIPRMGNGLECSPFLLQKTPSQVSGEPASRSSPEPASNRETQCEMDLVAKRWTSADSAEDEDCADLIRSVKRLRTLRDKDYVQIRAALADCVESLEEHKLKLVPDEVLRLFGLMAKPPETVYSEATKVPIESNAIDHHFLRNYQQSLCAEEDILAAPLSDSPDENLLQMIGLVEKESFPLTDSPASQVSKRKRTSKAVDVDDSRKQEERARKELREKLRGALATVGCEIKKLKSKAAVLRKLAKDETEDGTLALPVLLARLEQILSEL
ncbi:hypothetical protein RvY_15879 [Ramazzottius varieornatus]|uniref:Uncharacterized protein n=1 Tax=Ramazzottius varieornatus TaxID=947166 RepID=A0A1D1W353_RAMVA|nr:hypothetical protein RvY_15879 [Ramazzottius varieornatus]